MSLTDTIKSWFGVDHGRMLQGLAIAAVVVFFDLLTKAMATAWLADGPFIIIENFFDFVLVHNLGAAFGIFADQPAWVRSTLLLGIAFIASVYIIQQLRYATHLFVTIAFSLVLGGAIGNVSDRLRLGWVVDFIHIHWYDLSWPVFNVADSAITIGVGMLFIDNFKKTDKSDQ